MRPPSGSQMTAARNPRAIAGQRIRKNEIARFPRRRRTRPLRRRFSGECDRPYRTGRRRAVRRKQGRHRGVQERCAAYAESLRPLHRQGPAGQVRRFVSRDRNVANAMARVPRCGERMRSSGPASADFRDWAKAITRRVAARRQEGSSAPWQSARGRDWRAYLRSGRSQHGQTQCRVARGGSCPFRVRALSGPVVAREVHEAATDRYPG